jgi:hypothetical protein
MHLRKEDDLFLLPLKLIIMPIILQKDRKGLKIE